MSMPTLTTEQIHQTADAIAAKGERPTQVRVRAALGRGSFTTIGEAMKGWHEQQSQQAQQEVAKVEMPKDVRERLESAGATLWAAATAEADRRLAAEREALAEARQQADVEIAENKEALTVLESEAAGMEDEIATLRESLTAAEQARSEAINRATKAEQESQHQRSSIERLEGERADLREQLAAANEKSARSEQLVDDLRTQITKMQTQADQAAAKYDAGVRELREQLDAVMERAIRGEQRADGLGAQIEQMQAAADRAEQQHQDVVGRMEGEQKQLRERLDTVNDRAARAEQQVADLTAELSRERDRLDALLQGQGKPQPRRGGPKKDSDA